MKRLVHLSTLRAPASETMIDSRHRRQIAAQHSPAQASERGKRPEDLDEQQTQDIHGASPDAPETQPPGATSDEAIDSQSQQPAQLAGEAAASGGVPGAVVGAGALGLAGLAAVASGGGSKSGDFKPPVIETPKPEKPTPTPQPERPAPGPDVPAPDPDRPAPDAGKPKPDPDKPTPTPEKPTPEPEKPAPSPEKPTPEPEKPVTKPPALTVTLVNDTGSQNDDRITSDAELKIGNLAAGATWRYSVDGGEWKDGNAAGVISASEFAGISATRQVRVEQSNAAGASDQATFEFRLDTIAPDKIVAAQAGMEIHDQGSLDVNLIANRDADFSHVQFSLDRGQTWVDDKISAGMLVGNNGARDVLVRQVDKAGNASDALDYQFTLNTTGPSVSLKYDTGEHADDRVTNISTVVIGDLEPTASWRYSLDGGRNWKGGGATKEIAASEFGFEDGARSVLVQQFSTDGSKPFEGASESAIRTYEFNFQRQAIAATIGTDWQVENTLGTAGADRFVVGVGKKGAARVEGYRYSEGDVIDLRGLFQVDEGKQLSDYFSVAGGGGRALSVSYSGEIDKGPDLTVALVAAGGGDYTVFSVLYSGGVFFHSDKS